MDELNIPDAFKELAKPVIGDKLDDFLDALTLESPTSIRLNPLKHFNDTDNNPIPWASNGRYLSERPSFTLDPNFHAGSYYVQEPSSMFLEQVIKAVIDLSKPLRVLDLCAAPGGKSTHLLSLLSPESLLVSNEVIRSRATILSENIQKWGYPNVVISQNDPSDFSQLEGFFDIILVDSPCSGEGLFRKDNEAIKHWSLGNVELCSLRQQRILDNAWPALKHDGILIYSTCTYNEKENEKVLMEFQKNHEVEFLEIPTVKEWGVQDYNCNGTISYRLLPHKVKGEGFFISAFRKGGEQPEVKLKTKLSFNLVPTSTKARLSEWLTESSSFTFILIDELIIALKERHLHEIEFLNSKLTLISKGVAIAKDKRGKFVPEHASALSTNLQHLKFPTIELSEENAVKYLQKESFKVDLPIKGFALITYNQNGIGWINVLENRFNNLYPANWRIRMR